MRINIASKLFLGFLAIVFLNMFYMVVVLRFTDLKAIAHILKKQDWTQQGFLRISSLHDSRRRSHVIYDRIRKEESVQNFDETSEAIGVLLDSMVLQLDSVLVLDSAIAPPEGPHVGIRVLANMVKDDVMGYNRQYASAFADLIEASSERSSVLRKRKMSMLNKTIGMADSGFTASLNTAKSMVDTQTKLRIREIESRIDNSKQVTMVILIGVSLFAAAFALVFSSAITKRLRKLRDSASYIGRGDFYFDPSGYAKDEIGDLASAFFDMAINLKKSQEELVRSKRLAAIGEIVASVNHEINNPLMIISGNAQFLEMSAQEFPDEIKDRIRTIQTEAERISEVTRKLREIKNPVAEDYTSSGEQMINLDKSSRES